MRIRPQSKNISGYENTGLSGGATVFMKAREVFYRSAAALTAVGGMGLAIAGVATGNDAMTGAGMGLIAATILPASAASVVKEDIRVANKNAKMALATAGVSRE